MIELLAATFSLTSVFLTAKKNKLCWLVGILGIIGYSILFYQKSEWSNFSLQFIFLIQSIWGWVKWNEPEKEITSLNKESLFSLFIVSIFGFFTFDLITTEFYGNFTILDSVTSVLSLVAMVLLGFRKLESWLIWMVADIIYIYFFFINSLYLSSGLYFIFLILSIYGYINWKKQLKKQ